MNGKENRATKLQRIRQASGMTQAEAADACGVSLGVWRHYEQGSRSFDGAALPVIIRAAIVLKCRIEELIQNPEIIRLLEEYRNEIR